MGVIVSIWGGGKEIVEHTYCKHNPPPPPTDRTLHKYGNSYYKTKILWDYYGTQIEIQLYKHTSINRTLL